MKPLFDSTRHALRTAAVAAITLLAIAACTSVPPPTSPPTGHIAEDARACARSISSSPPGASVMTTTCRESPTALTVLSAAQEKFNSLENLTTDLTAKLTSSEDTVAALRQELDDTATRTSQARDQLLEANDDVSSQTATRIRTNLETQAILEDSSIDIASMTVGTVQSRIDHATALEETWMTRYTDLEERYDTLRELLSAESSELLTAQILLDQERAQFDRIVTNAILTGTREQRERLNELETQADELYHAAQAATTQALTNMAAAAAVLSSPPGTTGLPTNSQLTAASCESAWSALELTTLSPTTTAAQLNTAWDRLKSACTS